MSKITVRLCKKESDDKIFQMWEDVPLGKEYVVLLDTKQTATGYNNVQDKFWKREIIFAEDGTWLPTELLERLDGTPI